MKIIILDKPHMTLPAHEAMELLALQEQMLDEEDFDMGIFLAVVGVLALVLIILMAYLLGPSFLWAMSYVYSSH